MKGATQMMRVISFGCWLVLSAVCVLSACLPSGQNELAQGGGGGGGGGGTGSGRYVSMVAPVGGESFTAPASLRLVAAAHDPNVFNNVPTEGHGGNASNVQFFVDNTMVLEQDGLDAEYWVFKGFTTGVGVGSHLVWARAFYTNPVLVIDSVPVVITIDAAPAYAQTVNLDNDLVLTGATQQWIGSPGGRIRVNGNGFRITGSGVDGDHVEVRRLLRPGEPYEHRTGRDRRDHERRGRRGELHLRFEQQRSILSRRHGSGDHQRQYLPLEHAAAARPNPGC